MHHVMEYRNHGALISCTCVLPPEGHHRLIEIPNWCLEGALFYISGCHPDLIVAIKPIHEGKHGMSNLGSGNLSLGQWEFVLRASSIEIPKIYIAVDLSILLLYKHIIGQPPWVLDRLDKSYHQ